ncbi:hypothetical protein BO94DRAFT_380240 [Aspergillus sclerotioniger CBS 115572]|uniref:Uncharacterized protein n=1 Tax=Aspergillus sclerotioniger CBS 115572 TaxID=1450535 RepID=A0A317X2G4_9EURO|nr:hypothetical protein BO94DRAFT_380240 [Aspergillus sclerotioniger CBS 115572]PWY91802.1 hypothetical protein BO94DRAFT_380240 [Aspergillus sclerotioniger CBS 115572]
MFANMDRQISYTGPLPSTTSKLHHLPQIDPLFSLPSVPYTSTLKPHTTPMNHPLPPKPPVSKNFISGSFAPPHASATAPRNAKGKGNSNTGENMGKLHTKRAVCRDTAIRSPVNTLGISKAASQIKVHGRDDLELIDRMLDDLKSLDELDDLPHPDTLFSFSQKDDNLHNKSPGEPLGTAQLYTWPSDIQRS